MSPNYFSSRIWLALMVMAISLSGTSALAQGGTLVRVDPPVSTALVNDNVNVSIKVDNIFELTAIELHLTFNSGMLEVVQMTNGGFVAADFIAQNTYDNGAGTIDFAIAQMNRPAAQGSGTLLNIVFRAKANGSSPVTLRATQAVPSGLLLADQNGMAIQASWSGGTINVGPPTAIPPSATATATATATSTTIPPTGIIPSTETPTATPTATSTATPTATPIPPMSPPPSVFLGTHVVRWGEYLYCIGRAYGVSPWVIAEANGVWWPYIVFPNQKLLIPNVQWSPIPSGRICQAQFTVPTTFPTAIPPTTLPPTTIPTTAIPPVVTTVPPIFCRYYYTVSAGDNLYSIGLRYGVSYWDIARVNQIPNPRLIYSGQILCIP